MNNLEVTGVAPLLMAAPTAGTSVTAPIIAFRGQTKISLPIRRIMPATTGIISRQKDTVWKPGNSSTLPPPSSPPSHRSKVPVRLNTTTSPATTNGAFSTPPTARPAAFSSFPLQDDKPATAPEPGSASPVLAPSAAFCDPSPLRPGPGPAPSVMN
jgi:hypothetical protein